MAKKEKIENFVESTYKNSDYMEVIHLVLIGRLGWTKYNNLNNKTGNKLVKLVEKYLVEKDLFMDFGFAYGFSKEQLRGIGELMFSDTPTELDLKIKKCV